MVRRLFQEPRVDDVELSADVAIDPENHPNEARHGVTTYIFSSSSSPVMMAALSAKSV